MKKSLSLLWFFTVIPAFAFDPVLLQCSVKGSIESRAENRKFSENIEIDVYEISNQIVFDINGPTISGIYMGTSFTGKSGVQYTGKNIDTPDSWEFSEKTVRLNGTNTSESGRIDRRTGSFSYQETSILSNKATMYISAAGTCLKLSNIKKF